MNDRREVRRADEQIDRQIQQQSRTDELVKGLGDDSSLVAESSRRTVAALIAGSDAEEQVERMPESPKADRPQSREPCRRRWWQRLLWRH
jgi:hypothetical protein